MTIEGVRIALSALRGNKLRTFLTLLGNIVGTMAVIAVVSLLSGVDSYTREELISEGANVITLQRFDPFTLLTDFEKFLKAARTNPRLDWDDYEYIRAHVPSADAIDITASRSATIRAGDRALSGIRVDGRTESAPLVENLKIAGGRAFTLSEVTRRRAVAVLGSDVAERLFPGRDPVDRTIKIAGRRYDVIGVASPKPTQFGTNQNMYVLVPYPALEKTFGRSPQAQIKLRAPGPDLVSRVTDEAQWAMRIRHKLKPSIEDDFALTTSEQILSIWESISRAIFQALVGLASISLVIGGVVLMNVMLVAVTERTHEVGLRKALGAKRSDILLQFLAESVTLSLIGGMIGVLLGFGIAALISALSPIPSSVQLWAILAGLGVTILIGVLFGTYPANRAALLDPVEALRHE